MRLAGAQSAALALCAVLSSCGEDAAPLEGAQPSVDLADLGTELTELGGGVGPGGEPLPDLSTLSIDDLSPEMREHLGRTTDGEAPPEEVDGLPLLTWRGMRLPDDRLEDLLDSLIYPDEYTEEERTFPARLRALDGQRIAVRGYMIPTVWEEGEVTRLMLVGDLLACCFGIAPEPDQWLDVRMVDGGADYFIQLPVVIKGVFRIKGIADEAGYAAGCYVFEATSLERTAWE